MSNTLTLSCEFFPPKTEKGFNNLRRVREALAPLSPAFYSVTFGAGGSTQDNTIEAVLDIQEQYPVTGINAAPHLSCVGSSADRLREMLDTYRNHNIRHIVALRGDLPSGMRDPGDFRYASELVEFIRKESGDYFTIEVAAYPEVHPQAQTAEIDLINFKRKVDAGADSAITQYFYNIDAYRFFLDRCQKNGIDIPIVPGIMPINNFAQLARFSASCGAEIPRWLRKRLEEFYDDTESMKAFTLDFLTDFTHQLIELGVPGLHFYTMNKTEPTLTICQRLNLITQKT
ncbi:MAG: methylenetetrahydrofolate reductase [NAD(P)H] [Methylophaga sp.]